MDNANDDREVKQMKRTILVTLFVALAAGACKHSAEVSLGSPFTITPGTVARVDGTGLEVTFVGVESDNRCPVGVDCITAGEAIVSLIARAENGDAEALRLHLPGGGTPGRAASAEVGGYHVYISGLDPAPRAGERPDSSAYVATLQVTR